MLKLHFKENDNGHEMVCSQPDLIDTIFVDFFICLLSKQNESRFSGKKNTKQ